MEKKIAVLESLRNAHHKEIIRSRFQLENLQRDKESVQNTLSKLTLDESNYKSQLQFDKEGTKLNPIQLNDCKSVDAEAIGIYLIKLAATWKPDTEENNTKEIGNLYGFDLYIRSQKETYEDKGLFEYRYHNIYYAESKNGIKYSWNQGHINIDNPKIAARYFLNSIDRVESLKEKYQKNLHELDQNIPMLQQIIAKPFEKENELTSLKKDALKLEREISIKIQVNQMKQHVAEEIKEAPVIKMDCKEIKPEQILKKEKSEAQHKSMRI